MVANILPQQQLLLELLMMSGDIAATDVQEGSALHRTLNECEAKGWVSVSRFGPGFNKVTITDAGRSTVKTAWNH